MRCPYCGHEEARVLDSRESADAIRRRRSCEGCGKRFTTYEKIEPLDLFVVKKDGRREPFSREKIKTGITKACEKRPVPLESIEKAVDDIEARVRRLNKKEIPTRIIGELVVKKLRKIDKVAYIRFASVYREFADITSFEREVHDLLREARAARKMRAHPESLVSRVASRAPKPQKIALEVAERKIER